MKPAKSIIVSFCFIVTSCHYDPYASDLTTKEPALKDVVGTYYFEKQTVRNDDGLTAERKATINLNEDGTYKVTNNR